MFFGAYLAAIGLLFILGLAILILTADGTAEALRGLLRAYAWRTLALSVVCLVGFVGLSITSGLMRVGQAIQWRYPGDYLSAGLLGWALLALSLVGVAAPLLVVAWLRRRSDRSPWPRAG